MKIKRIIFEYYICKSCLRNRRVAYLTYSYYTFIYVQPSGITFYSWYNQVLGKLNIATTMIIEKLNLQYALSSASIHLQ